MTFDFLNLIIWVIVPLFIFVGIWRKIFGTWKNFCHCLNQTFRKKPHTSHEDEPRDGKSPGLKIILWLALNTVVLGVFILLPYTGLTSSIREHDPRQDAIAEQYETNQFEIKRNGDAYGPYSGDELMTMIINGEAFDDDKVRFSGDESWMTIEDLRKNNQLALPHFSHPRNLPGGFRWVWLSFCFILIWLVYK